MVRGNVRHVGAVSRRPARRLVGGLAGAAAVAAVLAGCGQQPNAAHERAQVEPAPAPAPPPAPASSSEPPTSSSPAPAPPEPSATTRDSGACKAGDLRVTLGGGDAAAGTAYRSLVFTNTSAQRCTIAGYPGVSYVGGEHGDQIGEAAFRSGGERTPVTLGKGDSATAEVGFVRVQNYDAPQCQPQPARGLRVYPPHDTASVFVEQSGTGCANDRIPGHQLTIKPVQQGSGD